MKVKVTQSCLTLCDPTRYTVHGILQARTLERVAVPFSTGSSQPRDRTQVSHSAGGFFTREAQAICLSKQETQRQGSIPGSEKAPGGGNSSPLQYSCLEKSHGQRSLAGYSPWGHKESNTSEHLSTVCLTDNGKEKNALFYNKYWPPMSPSD